MNKEHLFADWLIRRCQANASTIRWGSKMISPLAATVPLCKECNSEFGAQLEGPAKTVFEELESGRSVNDEAAELLIRWMWKIQGLGWIASRPYQPLPGIGTLRARVLEPIVGERSQLVLCLARFRRLDEQSVDYPMGLDSRVHFDLACVAGVFSRLAMIVCRKEHAALVPVHFKRFALAPSRSFGRASGKRVVAPITLADDVEAVGVTYAAAKVLCRQHDLKTLQRERAVPHSAS